MRNILQLFKGLDQIKLIIERYIVTCSVFVHVESQEYTNSFKIVWTISVIFVLWGNVTLSHYWNFDYLQKRAAAFFKNIFKIMKNNI